MSFSEKDKKYFTIKWIICGTLEFIYTVSEIILFSKYDLEFLTGSFIILDIICAIVKTLASFIFITTFHKNVSAYSVPIITAMITHGVIIPILCYYTIVALVKKGLNDDQIAIMSSKFLCFIYEIFFCYFLLKHWNKIQTAKTSKKRLNWNRRQSSRSDPRPKKSTDLDQNKLRISEENLSPEEGQKKRYSKNQLYIHKCLLQNLKIANQKNSINYGTQRSLLVDADIHRVRSKSMQSRATVSSNLLDNSNQVDSEDEKTLKKQKQLQFLEILDEPIKSMKKEEVNVNVQFKDNGEQSKESKQFEESEESKESSATSLEKKSVYF